MSRARKERTVDDKVVGNVLVSDPPRVPHNAKHALGLAKEVDGLVDEVRAEVVLVPCPGRGGVLPRAWAGVERVLVPVEVRLKDPMKTIKSGVQSGVGGGDEKDARQTLTARQRHPC